MDTLPLEILVMICKDLTAVEVARCCAVSHTWRDMFNNDLLWKPYCSASMEETLRTTPCVVEPHFVHPEMEAANLSPITKWRLAYMREKHLWDNWQRRNYKSASAPKECYLDRVFLSNDLILIVSISSIKLFNTTQYPPVLLDEKPGFGEVFLRAKLLNDKVIIIYEKCCIVYNLDYPTLYEKCKIKVPNSEDTQLRSTSTGFAVTSNAIFGINRVIKNLPPKDWYSKTLHIWDVETGTKLKVENSFPGDYGFSNIFTSETTDNAVIVIAHIRHSEDIVFTYSFRIYNGKNLKYLPFVEEIKIEYTTEQRRIKYTCIIHRDFVAIAANGTLNIYNYQSHQLLTRTTITTITSVILFTEHFLTSLDVIDDCFAFISDQTFKLFQPKTCTFVVSFYKQATKFNVISDSLVWFNCDLHKNEFWKIRRDNQHRCFVSNVPFPLGKVNRASTRAFDVKYKFETTGEMSSRITHNVTGWGEWSYYW